MPIYSLPIHVRRFELAVASPIYTCLFLTAGLSQPDFDCKFKEMSGRLPVIPFDHNGDDCDVDEIEGFDNELPTYTMSVRVMHAEHQTR